MTDRLKTLPKKGMKLIRRNGTLVEVPESTPDRFMRPKARPTKVERARETAEQVATGLMNVGRAMRGEPTHTRRRYGGKYN